MQALLLTPQRAAVGAFTSALLPAGFLALATWVPMEDWFDVVFVAVPMLYIPAIVILRRRQDNLGLRIALLAAYAGLGGFASICVLLAFHLSNPDAVPAAVFMWLLGLVTLAGAGVLLASLFARSLPGYLALLGVVAAAAWLAILVPEIFRETAPPWLGAAWLVAHAAFGLGLGFHLKRQRYVYAAPHSTLQQ